MEELKRPNLETVRTHSEPQLPEYPQVLEESYMNAEAMPSIVDSTQYLELTRPFTITEFTDTQERAYFPNNDGEVSTMEQTYVSAGESSHGQEIKIEGFKRQ